jgi:hypothetical protein
MTPLEEIVRWLNLRRAAEPLRERRGDTDSSPGGKDEDERIRELAGQIIEAGRKRRQGGEPLKLPAPGSLARARSWTPAPSGGANAEHPFGRAPAIRVADASFLLSSHPRGVCVIAPHRPGGVRVPPAGFSFWSAER